MLIVFLTATTAKPTPVDSCYRDPHSPRQRLSLPCLCTWPLQGSLPATLRCLAPAPCLNWATKRNITES